MRLKRLSILVKLIGIISLWLIFQVSGIILLFNPYYSILIESISKYKDVWCTFSFLLYLEEKFM